MSTRLQGTGELPRALDVKALPREGARHIEIEATSGERAAIAARLGILRLDSLTASLDAEPWERDGACIRGRYRAVLEQACVVTLEPIAVSLDEPVEVYFEGRAGELPDGEGVVVLDPEAPDPPEPVPGTGVIEVGELVVQLLAVALDPYPRKPGAAFAPAAGEASQPAAPESPFAKLAALKPRQKG
jgi:hypothetical protein